MMMILSRSMLACAALIAVLSLASARPIPAHRRALRQATSGPLTTPISEATSLYNISGVWAGIGDQYDAAVWAAYFTEDMLPACQGSGNFTYKHWDTTLPDTLALAANGTSSGIGINGHDSGTYVLSDVTFDGKYLQYRADYDPTVVDCSRFMPYIDTRDGRVMASKITKTEWKLVDGKLETTDLSCQLEDTETAGCYPQDADTVHSVAVTTYRCVSGACAGYAPAVIEKQDEE